MTWRAPAEPEPFEIELVPLHGPGAGRDPDDRPPVAGVGTVPAVGRIAHLAVGRALALPPPRLGPDQRQLCPWPERRVHRLVQVPPASAAAALDQVLRSHRGRLVATVRVRRWHRTRAASPAWLDVDDPPARAHGVIDGGLHVHRLGRPTPVELVLEPWSEQQTSLSLQVRRGRFWVHLPRQYFDAAHRVMDELWHEIETAAAVGSQPRGEVA